jgi:hypothetical protein
MAREIDAPIDQAVQDFQFEIKFPLHHREFNRAIAGLVVHIYRNGLRVPRDLSQQEAMSQAVWSLETGYRGLDTMGYEGAFLDASTNDIEGMETVLFQLAELIREEERRKYIRWVLISHIVPLDWEKQCRLISAYMKKFGGFLPPYLSSMDPARLVDVFQALVCSSVST